MKRLIPLVAALAVFQGCDSKPAVPTAAGADEAGFSPATAHTRARQDAVTAALPLAAEADFEQARRGLIARDEALQVPRGDGSLSWDMTAYAHIQGAAPDTVNPSLWRQAQLNNLHGLYRVADGIYQLRGYDLANMTLIESDNGWIVVDPLTIAPTARAALAFARQHLGDKPVVAVLFTHSHIDHFGGIEGVIDPDRPPPTIVAPAGFMEEATSENVMAGVAMQRRASYMYGMRLPRTARGHVDTGLGKQPATNGHFSIRAPDIIVEHTGQTLDIDGVPFEFQSVPGSEAPAEFTFWLPRHKAFCGAELVSRTLHNVYTLRGAKVRDALRWSDYIDEALGLFGDQAEVYFASHHWPVWGGGEIRRFLKAQRDAYKYIHDQTVRLANLGHTPREIAEQVQLPQTLSQVFATRGYYGTVSHNSKAVYQWYFGWYDGNPAHLNPLPPADSAARYVRLAGGADAMLAEGERAFEAGDYRWAAELLNHLVFAQPDHAGARALLARCYDQLGYQSESGPWRDVYLSGAYELRHGGTDQGANLANTVGLLRAIPMRRFFESMAARLNGPKAEGKALKVNMVFSDLDESYVLEIENAVLHHRAAPPAGDADATLTLTHELFLKMAIGQAGIKDTLLSDELQVEGSRLDLIRFFTLLDKPDGTFNIIEP